MGRGKFKGKPTGRRIFSTLEEIAAGTSSRPRTFKRAEAEDREVEPEEEESEEDSSDENEKRKGTEGIIEIVNPNLVKPKTVKARDANLEKTTELSRREREEIEKHQAHERYMRLQEQGKTDQAKKDLERLSLIRQQRADAAKKREEEKAAKETKRAEACRSSQMIGASIERIYSSEHLHCYTCQTKELVCLDWVYNMPPGRGNFYLAFLN